MGGWGSLVTVRGRRTAGHLYACSTEAPTSCHMGWGPMGAERSEAAATLSAAAAQLARTQAVGGAGEGIPLAGPASADPGGQQSTQRRERPARPKDTERLGQQGTGVRTKHELTHCDWAGSHRPRPSHAASLCAANMVACTVRTPMWPTGHATTPNAKRPKGTRP